MHTLHICFSYQSIDKNGVIAQSNRTRHLSRHRIPVNEQYVRICRQTYL